MKNGIVYYGDYYFDDGLTLNCLNTNPTSKYILLIGRYTLSSGEIVACSSKAQKNVLLLGEKTEGFTTSNDWTVIADQIFCNIGVSYFMDKDGNAYLSGIKPDIDFKGDYNPFSPSEDKIIEEAVGIINTGFNT